MEGREAPETSYPSRGEAGREDLFSKTVWKRLFRQRCACESSKLSLFLDLGYPGQGEIEILTDDTDSKKYTERLRQILLNG